MRAARWIILAVGLAVSFIPAPAAAKELYTFKVGQWAGWAWQDRRTGKFSHCTIRVRYRSGLRFSLSHFISGRYSISLQKPAWHLGRGKRYDIGLLVDGEDLGRFRAKALNDQLLALFLPGNSPVIKKLRIGSRLTVRAAQRDFKLALTDSTKAIERLKACVDLEHESAGRGANPFARDLDAAPGPARPGAGTPLAGQGGRERRVQRFIRTLLKNAGLEGIRFEPRGTRKSKSVVASWRAPGIYGLYMVVRHKGRTIEEVTGPFLARVGKSCKGRYGYGADIARRAGSYVIKKSSAACSTDGKGRFYVFATSVRSARAIIIITHVARDRGQEELRAVNAQLENVLTRMLTKL